MKHSRDISSFVWKNPALSKGNKNHSTQLRRRGRDRAGVGRPPVRLQAAAITDTPSLWILKSSSTHGAGGSTRESCRYVNVSKSPSNSN
jgi:hypothetical protein